MIARKIEQVDERDRALLLAASVQGPEFDSAVVSEAIEMDPADVEERLDVLERVHVFVKRGERVRVSGPDADAALPVRPRALSEHALRLAAADAPRGAQRPGGPRARRRTASDDAGERRASGDSLRGGARLRHERALLLHRRAALGRPLRIPRGALAGGARPRRRCAACRTARRASSRSSACR